MRVHPLHGRPDADDASRWVRIAGRPAALIQSGHGVIGRMGTALIYLLVVVAVAAAVFGIASAVFGRGEELAPLPAGSYYHHQLRGLRVEDPQGRALGRVEDLLTNAGDAPVLVVRGAGGETLIPLADAFVRSVDLEGGRLVASRPETGVAEG